MLFVSFAGKLNMSQPLTKTALLGVAILFRVSTSWSETPTPTPTATCSDDTWTPTSTANAPSARSRRTGVWTDTEMIVWGGDNNNVLLNTGGRYNPKANSWMTISAAGAPSGRYDHSGIWTGSEMIVWGGWNGSSCCCFNTGGR